MKRIAQFFTTSVALCLLVAGCGNPSARPQGSLQPSSEPPVIQILSSQTATTVPTSSVSSTPVPTQRLVNPQIKTVQKPTTTTKPSATVKPTTADTTTSPAKPTPETPAYTDATSGRDAMMKGVNAARAEEGLESASLNAKYNAEAQQRARKMATALKKAHFGKDFVEGIGCMTGIKGAYNEGFVTASMHNRQLLGCSQYGIGIAIGLDGKYYYAIIGR